MDPRRASLALQDSGRQWYLLLGTLVSTQAPGPCTDEDMAATVCPHRSATPARGSIPRTCTSALYTLTCETLEIPPKALSPQHTGRKPRPSLQGPNEQAGRKPAGGTRAFLWSGSAGGLPAAGWGHWPLRGCRTRPGQALRAQPTQSRFVPAVSAQPSLHLVQSPRQPAQGSPARPAGTPGRRAAAASFPWPGPWALGQAHEGPPWTHEPACR